MAPWIKTLLNALVAGVVGGSVPTVAGGDWKEILAMGGVAIVLALFNLWQHRPDAKK